VNGHLHYLEKNLCPFWEWKPSPPAHGLVAKLTELSWIHWWY